MCKYCTLRRYKDGPIRSMKTRQHPIGCAISRIEWNPRDAQFHGHPFILHTIIGAGYMGTAVGITHCPWCGKELKPPKPPEGGCIATSLATGDVFMSLTQEGSR